ncbi:MAG: hypothetical protein ACXWJL_08355 [Xanthobacteraceae bacterium]
MKTLFAAVSALACIVGSTDGFARAGFAHGAGFAYGSGRGFRSVPAVARPVAQIDRAQGSYGFNRGYYGGPDHAWHGGPSFFRGGGVD